MIEKYLQTDKVFTMTKIEIGNLFKDSTGEDLEVVKISKNGNVLTCKDSRGYLIPFRYFERTGKYVQGSNRVLLTIQEGV